MENDACVEEKENGEAVMELAKEPVRDPVKDPTASSAYRYSKVMKKNHNSRLVRVH